MLWTKCGDENKEVNGDTCLKGVFCWTMQQPVSGYIDECVNLV